MNKLTIALLLLLLSASCTVQQRIYRPGWHVEWNHHSQRQETSSDRSLHSPSTPPTPTDEFRVAISSPETVSDFIPFQEPLTAVSLPPPIDKAPVSIAGKRPAEKEPLLNRIPVIRQFPPLFKRAESTVSGDTDTGEVSRPLDPLIIIMWVINGIAVIAFLLIIFFALFGSSLVWLPAALTIAGIWIPVSLIINVVLGILVRQRQKIYPGRYADFPIGISIFGAMLLILGLFFLFILIVILIYLIPSI